MTFICTLCEQSSATLTGVVNARGVTLGLFCPSCETKMRSAVDRVNTRHGAYIVAGQYQCSPRGTPHDPAIYLQEARA